VALVLALTEYCAELGEYGPAETGMPGEYGDPILGLDGWEDVDADWLWGRGRW
jgi:hypothetical protein